MTAPYQAVAPRLEAKSTLVPFCGCKLWFGPAVPRGYGVLSVNGRQTYTHRAAWELIHGPIPDGLHVLHECDVPACINVNHLFLGTPMENTKDMVSKGRAKYLGPPKGDRNPMRMHKGLAAGERNPSAKLDWVAVTAIRSMYKRGHTKQADIAKIFGIKQAQVSSIVRGESWTA